MSRFLRRTAAVALLALPLLPSHTFAAPGHGALAAPLARAGVIKGRVTDKESGQPVVSAQIVVVGAAQRIGAISDANGNYTLTGAPAGQATLRVTRIGYQPMDQTVSVPADGSVTADFGLSRAVARLEEVVTTATGEQSRREMGNVVASIMVDSIAKTSPIQNITEMMQARASGVQVIQTQGVIGASPNIRIRGIGSLSLSNEPLVVLDGVRFSNENEPGNVSAVRISRISTLDPEDVESIDVIKGPSAAALYGTAAANGVIVIKTKRGRAGSTRWTAFGETGITVMPSNYPANYWTFGRNIVNGVPVTGATPIHCTLAASALGQCLIDSTSSYNPWTDSRSDPFKNGPSARYGFQASGGSESLRFFFSADRQGETGPYYMPAFEQDRLTTLHGYAPNSQQVRPNQLHQTSVRGNFTFTLAPSATLDISGGYQDRDLWSPFDGTFFQGLSNQLFSAPGFKTASNGTAGQFVGDIYSVGQRNTLERFTGTTSLNWTPIPWFQFTAEGGIDNSNANNAQNQLPGEGPTTAAWGPSASQGFSGVDIFRTNSLQYTATIRGAANRKLTNTLTSNTTVGGQWFKSGIYQLFGEGYGLGVGSTTPNAASQRLASTTTTENATYGAFVQEQLNWRDRLYGTVSARTDQNSAFGRSAGTTLYPSANISYVISDESWFPHLPGVSRLRLRSTVGQAGLPPGTTAALAFLSALTYPAANGDNPGLTVASIGNADLRPEVTTEYEGGFDMGALGDRVNIEFTLFNKVSRDQIFARPLPPSFGAGGTQTVNVAKVINRGIELAVDGNVIDRRALTWNVRLNGSHLNNKLADIGTVVLPTTQGVRNVVGYPLFGIWDRPYTYKDANGDGIITASEITLAAADSFRGSTLPLYEAGLSNSFGLLNNRFHVTALLDYRGSFWNTYTIGSNRCVSALNCEAINVKGSSLADQAAAVAAASAALKNTKWGIYQPNDFVKLREISVTADLPANLTSKFLRGRTAQLVLSGRNLATLWTKYPGIDPEANRSANGNDDLGTPPAIRLWLARFNIAF
ncbi:MAG: putative outer membrane protein [Gemmatimonadetes bacterium]|nr:putative outer membrane protein [Gemmatimonadota bacterium]